MIQSIIPSIFIILLFYHTCIDSSLLSPLSCENAQHDAASLLTAATDHIRIGHLYEALPILNHILDPDGACAKGASQSTKSYARFHRASIALAFGDDKLALQDALVVNKRTHDPLPLLPLTITILTCITHDI
jgi:hypothetical protein